MDVAKYIGLFLLKNNFVYIHGLGNLELRKKPASFSGDKLHAPSYEVNLSTSGSIDDNLANFIANNEQISISKASNALREFSTKAKAELQEGKTVEIPGIGKFTELKGKIGFETSPAFQYAPPSLPTIKVVKREEPVFGSGGINTPAQRPATFEPQHQQQPFQPTQPQLQQAPPPEEIYEEQPARSSVNWPRVVIALGVLILLAVGAYLFISKMAGQKPPQKEIKLPEAPAEEQTPATTNVLPQDTTLGEDLINVEVKLHAYPLSKRASAYKRREALKKLGFETEISVGTGADSFVYIMLPVNNVRVTDTIALVNALDSLNPGKVLIMKRWKEVPVQ